MDRALVRAQELGATVAAPKNEIAEGYWAHIKDTEGNLIGVYESKNTMQQAASGEAGHGIVDFRDPDGRSRAGDHVLHRPVRLDHHARHLDGRDGVLDDQCRGSISPVLSGGGMIRRQMPTQTVTNYVNVESIDAAAARAQELGATLIVPKMAVGDFGALAVLLDTESNVFAIWESNRPRCRRARPRRQRPVNSTERDGRAARWRAPARRSHSHAPGAGAAARGLAAWTATAVALTHTRPGVLVRVSRCESLRGGAGTRCHGVPRGASNGARPLAPSPLGARR